MITLVDGQKVYNVSEICYKPYSVVKVEEIEGRRYPGIYNSPKVFVLNIIGNVSKIEFNKHVIEIVDKNPASNIYTRFTLREPTVINFVDGKLVMEVTSWLEEYIES